MRPGQAGPKDRGLVGGWQQEGGPVPAETVMSVRRGAGDNGKMYC